MGIYNVLGWRSCHVCGLELNRDHNPAINIKNSAVGHPVEYKKHRISPMQ